MRNFSKTTKYFLLSLPWLLITAFYFYQSAIARLFTPAVMGFDGLDYATLAIHLAHHVGSFWSPEFTATRYTHFYEHPPVGIWYFAIFYKLFGDSWHTDKIIALFDALWMMTIITLFFRRDFPKTTRWLIWLPILLFASNPFMYFYLVSNKFECLELPLSLTVLYWLSQCRYRAYSLKYLSTQSVIIGFICVAGFEINGLLFLYLWAGYLLCAYTGNFLSLKRAIFLTLLLVASSFLFYGLLMWLVPAARHNNWMYFSTQLFPALLSQRTDDLYNSSGIGRIVIIGLYLEFISIWLILTVIGWALLQWRNHLYVAQQTALTYIKQSHQHLFFYVALSVMTTLPLLASGKILAYYNLQTNAFLTLMLCCLLTPSLQGFYESNRLATNFLIGVLLAPLFAYGYSIQSISYLKGFENYNRARMALIYTRILEKYIPKNSIVSTPTYILPHAITYLEPNLARLMNVSIMPGGGCQYYIDSIYNFLPPPKGYHKIDTPMTLITLYKRDHALPSCKPVVESWRQYHNYGQPLNFFI